MRLSGVLLDISVGQPGIVRTRKKVRWDPSVGKPTRQSYVNSYSQLMKKRQSMSLRILNS
jgi:hypothetical protein